MDTFSRFGLIFLLVLGLAILPRSASANDPASALAACSSKLSVVQANTYGTASSYTGATCQFVSADVAGTAGYYFVGGNAGRVGCSGMFGEIPGNWQDCLTASAAPSFSCSGVPDSSGWAMSATADATSQICDTMDYRGTTQGKGCVETFTPSWSMPVSDGGSVATGYYQSGSYHASGTECTQNADGTFTPDSGTPTTPPPKSGTAATPSPKVCGGGSCIDPGTGQACIVDSSGQQYCTPVGSASPTAPSNCYSDGSSSSLCIGNPTPPTPPNPPITDPATQAAATDKYPATNNATGATSVTTVNVYNGVGAQSSSGATSGSLSTPGSGPASSSSSGGTGSGKGFGGGTDCNTPPVCTGDAVMCGTAKMQWAQFCRLHKDVGSDQPAPSLTSLSPANAGSVWTANASTGDATADAALQGNFDSSGFGYSSDCPMKDLTVDIAGHSFVVPISEGCVIGPWLYYIVLGMATLWAAMIVVKGA